MQFADDAKLGTKNEISHIERANMRGTTVFHLQGRNDLGGRSYLSRANEQRSRRRKRDRIGGNATSDAVRTDTTTAGAATALNSNRIFHYSPAASGCW